MYVYIYICIYVVIDKPTGEGQADVESWDMIR